MAESHVRIDEGVKRGPKIPRRSVTRRRDEETDRVEGIPANLDPQAVLELYMGSQTTSGIAKTLGVKRKTLVGWLRETVPLQWKALQTLRAEVLREAAEDEIAVARDALSLARAREALKSAQWSLERLDSKNYGVKQEVTVKTEEHISLVLEGDVQGLIEKIAAKKQSLQVIDLPSDAVQHLDKPNP